MKVREIIAEADGKMHDQHKQVQKGVVRMRDIGGYDRVYHLNRIMMAAGMADGKSENAVTNMDSATWIEKFNSGHPYTEEEYKKLRSAMKTVPTDGADVTPWAKSAEPKDTYKHSPVSKPKKNKYGI